MPACLPGSLLAIQLILCHFVEVKRFEDIVRPGSQAEPGTFLGMESSFKGVEVGYPGGPFDPIGLSRYVGDASVRAALHMRGRHRLPLAS